MKSILTVGAVLVSAVLVPAAAARTSDAVFPSQQVKDVFVAAQTVNADGVMTNTFAPGSRVIFRAYAVDTKTHKIVRAKGAQYFYVTIPNQPNVKLTYDPTATGANARLAWTGSWTVPAAYPTGIVPFKVHVKTATKLRGQFVQFPVASSVLTILSSPPPTFTPGPTSAGTAPADSLDVSLYVDSVNGTRPTGAPARPIGCTQTNVFKRGEQFVLRTWGTDLTTGDVLSSDNVSEAHFTIAGQPDIKLNWGAHGAVGAKVFFWTNAWNIPADFPLGELTVHVVFTLESGKTGSYDHIVSIIP
ncbi:MAG: hypothetical protein ACYDA3_07995 [Gaiellaceae bacterium]